MEKRSESCVKVINQSEKEVRSLMTLIQNGKSDSNIILNVLYKLIENHKGFLNILRYSRF